MKSLDQVEWDKIFVTGLTNPMYIATSHLNKGNKELDIVFSRQTNPGEACLFLARVYEQLSEQPQCVIKRGRSHSIRFRYLNESATFLDFPQIWGVNLLDHSTHHKFLLSEGNGELAKPLVLHELYHS